MRMYFQYANIFYPLLGVAEVVEHQEDGPHGELGSGDQDQEVAQAMSPLWVAVMLSVLIDVNKYVIVICMVFVKFLIFRSFYCRRTYWMDPA